MDRTAGQIARDLLDREARAGTWWFDQDTRQLWWSPGIYRLHGLDPSIFTPTLETAIEAYKPESRRRVRAAVEQAMATGEGWNLNLELQRPDGQVRHVQALGEIERRQGKAPLLAGVLIDVHDQTVANIERQTLEQQLWEHNERWRIAGESVGLGLIELDFDTEIYRVSGAFAHRLDPSADRETEIPRAQWLSYVHSADYPGHRSRLDGHLKGETPFYTSDYRLRIPGAEEIWVKEAGRFIDSREPECRGRLVGTLTDISGRKHTEQVMRTARHRLEQTLRHAPIGIALVSLEGCWLSVNQSLCGMLGYTETELLESTFQDITHPDDLAADLAQLRALLAGHGRAYRMEKRYFHKQGYIVDVQLDVSLLRDQDGEPVHFISQIQDVTERKRAHHALFEANELAQVTFEAIGEGVIRIDSEGWISDINTAGRSLLGMADETPVGRYFSDVISFYDADEDRRLPDPLSDVLNSGERARVPIFTRLLRADGTYVSIVDSISPIRNEAGDVQGAVFVFQDISEARRMTDELTHQARHDELTGLPNRRGFEEVLERSWKRVCAGMLGAFVMYLDLDHFKVVNDTCGHSAGDELLRQVAFQFRSMLRGSDALARLGGDEFAAIIYAKDVQGAEIVADKFIRAVGDMDFTFGGRSYKVGVSVGIAALDTSLDSTETALIHADAALYIAKDSGRNRYQYYRVDCKTRGRAAAYVNTAQMLQSGLEQSLFTLYLQAIVDASAQPIGYEALLRLAGPDGIVAPDAFLPTAKRLGLMSQIDRWVVTEAVRLIEDYDERGLWPSDRVLSINLSPVSLADPQFHGELITLLDQHKARAQRFVFEITESDALFGEHYPKLIQNLRDRGFSVWLDDFASGYNSFDMLKRAAVDGIKIDRSFVRDLECDPIDRAVIRSIGDVSDALSLQVIAEGVETQVAFDLLQEAGITCFQGYLFHRPEPAEKVLAQVARKTATGVNPNVTGFAPRYASGRTGRQ